MRNEVLLYWYVCACVNLDFKRVNVEYARGTLNYSRDDTSSRTHGIQTVSRSCEYACGFSNYQVDEKLEGIIIIQLLQKKNGDLFQSNSCVILAQGPCYRSNRINIDCAMQ